MSNKFAVIGGDRRNVELAKMLANDSNQVFVYGLDKIEENELLKSNIEICNTLEESVLQSDIVIGPIPFTRDNQYLNLPLSSNKIEIEDFASWLDNKALFSGSIPEFFFENTKNVKVVITDLMKIEKLAILNCIATAEGTICKIIENTTINLQNSNILIVGFGRIGKILSKKLNALGANITCSARKEQDLAWIEAYGYNKVNTYMLEKVDKYDVIINTVPHVFFDKNILKQVNKETILLELASKPGGFDLDIINSSDYRYVSALGLPGKYAEKTSAKYIKDVIYEELKL